MSSGQPLCRDCSARSSPGARRCHSCGSPRLLRHPALDRLAIAHLDCDAFYAAVEKRDNPALIDKPVIIGGGRRGVVSTACYVARLSGVRSAMPMFKALEACPHAVVIKPDMAKYAAVGREVRERMLALTPLVEPLSIDEAFLDLSGTEQLHGGSPATVLVRLSREIERDIGISVSIGLSGNKFLAKIASDLDKPRGFSVIDPVDAPQFLASRPVSFIWGVGKSFSATLEADGFRTIADLQRADPLDLFRRYGASGQRLSKLSFGLDDRVVDPNGDRKSVSAETTFDDPISGRLALETIIWKLSEKVARQLKAEASAGRTVTLKLKTADFKLKTRSRRLPDPTALASRLDETARDLLGPEADGTRYRLIGVGLSDLVAADMADPNDLVEPRRDKERAAETAVDALRAKFGRAAIVSGKSMRDR